jgi:hypothetical protein
MFCRAMSDAILGCNIYRNVRDIHVILRKVSPFNLLVEDNRRFAPEKP